MKTATILSLALGTLTALAACSHDKPKAATTTPVTDTPPPPAAKQDQPPAPVTADQKVSPGIALSSDIAELCEIKPSPDANPKFDYDKDELTTDDRNVLTKLATCMTSGKLKGKTVSLIGRADPRGTEEYNLGLGSRRAAQVGQYLQRLGVGQPQLGVTTRGALDASGTDESTWKQDRRVDVQLAQQGTN